MKILWTFCLLAVFGGLSAHPGTEFDDLDDAILLDRIQRMDSPVTPVLNEDVRKAIRRYVTTGYRETQSFLGRAEMYFPIFEHYLRRANLPEKLKYLPIVESSLRPDVSSFAGAGGLWQFMPGTAREYDIVINNYVDERNDPIRATVAAMEHLQKQFDRYDDWALALAAYNCGAGNVNRAIRRAGGVKDFWKIRRYLPRETQLYVPQFIAASYVAEHFFFHNLSPAYPDADLQYTRTVLVNSYLSLGKVSKITGVPLKTLQVLNPHLRRNAVPYSRRGTYLNLPESAMYLFQEHLAEQTDRRIKCDLDRVLRQEGVERPEASVRSLYYVGRGDHLHQLGQILGVAPAAIRVWNQLPEERELYPGQALIVYLPRAELATSVR